MKHSEPRIQELAEAVQGALRVISDWPIMWAALPGRHRSFYHGVILGVMFKEKIDEDL